ncbi:TPA: ead/Ea22-like family protein [Enterobacter roggenkampii]|nr:ead/Ea22-like family protein [Enterobacter roggenkampii]
MSNIDKRALREAAANAKIAGEAPVMPFDQRITALNDFLKHCTPETVLVLLDELESKQTFQQAFFRQSLMYDVVAEAYEEAKEQIAKDVEIKARLCRESNSLFDGLRAAEKRIAELEAVKCKLSDSKLLSLAKDIVENLVDTGASDPEYTQQYIDWTCKRIRAAAAKGE